MLYRLKKKIQINDLLKNFKQNLKFYGNKKFTINNFCSINYSNSSSLSFIEEDNFFKKKRGIIISKKRTPFFDNQIVAKNPRLLFTKIINIILKDELEKTYYPINNFRNLHLKKNKKLKLSNNVFIGENVSIGKNCYIGNNVVIYPGTKIGNNVIILDNTVIGVYGLGYTDGLLMPHIGNVMIQDNVKLGANCTIVRGTLENTKIEKSVKVGNNVNIGHNVLIKNNSYISSACVIAGGTKIGSKCKLATKVSIKNNILIRNNCKIGIGSVVIKNTNKNSMIFGNPAKEIVLLKKIL